MRFTLATNHVTTRIFFSTVKPVGPFFWPCCSTSPQRSPFRSFWIFRFCFSTFRVVVIGSTFFAELNEMYSRLRSQSPVWIDYIVNITIINIIVEVIKMSHTQCQLSVWDISTSSVYVKTYSCTSSLSLQSSSLSSSWCQSPVTCTPAWKSVQLQHITHDSVSHRFESAPLPPECENMLIFTDADTFIIIIIIIIFIIIIIIINYQNRNIQSGSAITLVKSLRK